MKATTNPRADGGEITADSRDALRVGLSVIARAQQRVPLLQVGVLVALFAYGVGTINGFGSRTSIMSMLVLAAFLGIAAVGQTLVVLLGAIDLSIAAYILMGNLLTVHLVGQDGWPFAATLTLICVVAAIGGGLSGFICARWQANSLVVTLGISAIVSGFTVVLFGNTTSGPLPQWLVTMTSVSGTTLGVDVPPVVLLWAIIALIVGVVLARMRAGRNLYATGASAPAAALALVRTTLVWSAVFAVSAVGAAIAGILLTGFSGGANTSIGTPYLFTSLAAVVVGGTSFSGARGSYWHTCLGALILTLLTTILVGKGYDAADTQIVYGVVIMVVVGIYARGARIRDRI